MTTVFFSAGDASGDLHAAVLAKRLRERRPELRMLGMGGPEMERAGVEIRVPGSELAVGGLVELAASARRIASVWRRMRRELADARADLIVLVDSGAFNLPFARRARRISRAPILYFVPPQAWAWRRGRARKMAERVDCVAAILPFEGDVYARAGARVCHVGHPLVDRMARVRAESQAAATRASLGIDARAPLLALLPGSRRNEIAMNLPIHLAAARALQERVPRLAVRIAVAPGLDGGDVDALLAASARSSDRGFGHVLGRTHEVLATADVALVKPGTGTLEATLLGTPMVVAGRGHPLSAALVRRLAPVPFWSLPNLILGRGLVPELLQDEARPEAIADALHPLLSGSERETQRAGLAEAAGRLGQGGAAERVADLAEELLGERTVAT